MTTYVPTSRADIEDQRWLDGRIDAIEDGIDAVLDIAVNWSAGRGLSRLHRGVSAQDYILSRVKHPLGRGVIVPLLAESNWSNRQIAAVAGVDETTVRRTAAYAAVDRPAETLGADGKLRPARVVGTTTAEIIEPMPSRPSQAPEFRAPPFRVIAQAFERDIRRLLQGYRPHLDDERFAARFGAVIAAIDAALDQEG